MSELAREIHESGRKMVLAVTGGGIGAIHELLTTPGASRSILEAAVPYAAPALTQLLGGRPDQFCSSATARAMAMACFERGKKLIDSNIDTHSNLLGVGCTASLASDQPKRGDHRIHVAIQSSFSTQTASLRLVKERRTRSEEDEVASALLIWLIASHFKQGDWDWSTGFADEVIERMRFDAPQGWQKLLAGECAWTNNCGNEFGERLVGDQGSIAIYSGAFHPRHIGHEQIAQVAAKRFQRVIHEISLRNVDKPPLDFIEMAARAAQFKPHEEIIFSNAPTFVQKARIFPGCTFLVGVDTILRIPLPIYYGGEVGRDRAMEELTSLGSRFLVFGRVLDGKFQEFSRAEVPPTLASLCDVVSEHEFRVDISSSQIRETN